MTTYTEDFNRGSLGTLAPNGSTYVNINGWTIDANQALSPEVYSWNPLVYDHGLIDQTIEVDLVNVADVNDFWGIIIRYEDVDNWIVANVGATDTTFQIFRREAGFDHTISNFTMAYADPATLKVVVNGDYFNLYADNNFVGTGTSSFLSGNTTSGIASFDSSRYDNMVISDEAVAPVVSDEAGWGFIPIY